MEDGDEFSGLYFDDVQTLRVLDPEVEHQTTELKEECKEFLEKSEDFRQLVSDVLKLTAALAEEVEQEKMKAIACRNLFHSFVKARENKHEQLQELINEKLNHLERLRLQYSSLLKVEAEQNEFMEQFLLRKST